MIDDKSNTYISSAMDLFLEVGGLYIDGCYDVSKSLFLKLAKLSHETERNAFDIHQTVKHLTWANGNDGDTLRSESQLEAVEFAIYHRDCFEGIDLDGLKTMIQASLKWQEDQRIWRESYEFRRIEASQYTSNRSIRKKVFGRDGKACAHCGSEKQPTLDHIIAVRNNGENTLENLQVLCRSCNSKKGSK